MWRNIADRAGIIGRCAMAAISPSYRQRLAYQMEVEKTWAKLRAVIGDVEAELLIPEVMARGGTLGALESVYEDVIGSRP